MTSDEASAQEKPSGGARSLSNSDAATAAALARNDRYLFEFVEALSLCPWAKRCREMGRLAREVILLPGGAEETGELAALVDAACAQVRSLAAKPASEVEVGLLIFPALAPILRDGLEGARHFEHLCAAVRNGIQRDFARGDLPFFCVAFHPEFGMDLLDENRAVRFIRRSPDPTLQLVRASVLRDARGSNSVSTRYVDASKMTHEELMAVQRPMTISEKITKLNWETLLQAGPEKVRGQLEDLAARR